MQKAITAIGLAVIFLSGYVLFSMKREVETLSFELSEIQKQLNSEKGNINLLKTEYVYLTSPARLSKLATKYLNLSSTTPEQMILDPITQLPETIAAEKTSNKTYADNRPSRVTRWNYKHMGNKYIQKASYKKKQ
jgi:cell division protein FtsL